MPEFHALPACATKFCCCCCYFESNITCFIIAVLCLLFNVFSGVTNYGIWHWALYFSSLCLFGLHLFAGVLLLLGAYWNNYRFKLAYCWIVFFCMFFVIIAFVLFVVLHKSIYIIWGSKCHGFKDAVGFLIVALNSIWLIIFDFYSTLIVLGNLFECEECNDGNVTFYA